MIPGLSSGELFVLGAIALMIAGAVVYKSSVVAIEKIENFLKTSRDIFDKLARDMHPEY